MDLLLQVDNIFICCVLVRISSNHARSTFLLAMKLHLLHGVVVRVISKGFYAASSGLKVNSLANAASTYVFI